MIAAEGPSVVYWLGAGASANALPVVGEMPDAFNTQALTLQYWSNTNTRSYMQQQGLAEYCSYLNKMALWSREYGTIDTYARSLYLLNETLKLAELKLHLAIFFLLEQALPIPRQIPTVANAPNYTKRDRIDTRYMGWLALLMERDSALNKRVSVVSWNYDLQIEHALAKFRGYKDLSQIHSDQQVRIFPRPTSEPIQYKTAPSFVRLNGIAGHARLQDSVRVMYHTLYNMQGTLDNHLESIFRLYKDYDKREQIMLNSMKETLTFSWEDNEISSAALKLACMAMVNAKVLVIIGYSFPTFNRAIDKQLYKAFTSGDIATKRVVLQNGSMSATTFQQMMGQNASIPLVVPEPNWDQFYIPPELF